MSSPFVAEIRMFPYNFAPVGWALCNGQLMPINQNTALFSLIGTFYGGDGVNNFALPNLQGMRPIGQGSSFGVTALLGQTGGSSTITLDGTTMPVHSHPVIASSGQPNAPDPSGTYLGEPLLSGPPLYNTSAPNVAMLSALSATGGGLPLTRLQPYLVCTFCIALQGVYPSRG